MPPSIIGGCVVLVVGRAGRPDRQQVVVRGADGMRELADRGRILLAADRGIGRADRSAGAKRVSDSTPNGLNGMRR